MHFGIVAGTNVVAIPETSGSVFQESDGNVFEAFAVPGAILREGFESLPVVGLLQGGEGLGNGVFFDVAGESGEPPDERAAPVVGHGREGTGGV